MASESNFAKPDLSIDVFEVFAKVIVLSQSSHGIKLRYIASMIADTQLNPAYDEKTSYWKGLSDPENFNCHVRQVVLHDKKRDGPTLFTKDNTDGEQSRW